MKTGMTFSVIIFIACFSIVFCMEDSGKSMICQYWYSRVDPDVSMPKNMHIDETIPANILQAIECLLDCEGNKDVAKFWGATRNTTSGGITTCSVEVAALYYVSYLYYQDWAHAGAVTLIDANGKENTPEAIKKAYMSYRKWFDEVKKVGIEMAREMKLDPLCYADGVEWY